MRISQCNICQFLFSALFLIRYIIIYKSKRCNVTKFPSHFWHKYYYSCHIYFGFILFMSTNTFNHAIVFYCPGDTAGLYRAIVFRLSQVISVAGTAIVERCGCSQMISVVGAAVVQGCGCNLLTAIVLWIQQSFSVVYAVS